MRKSYLFLATAILAFASCSENTYLGDQDVNTNGTGAISFGFELPSSTRADKVGADAADLLGNQFIVTGIKATNGTSDVTQNVFLSYTVKWDDNSAGTTESNTSDWEYVYGSPYSAVTTVTSQTIKYWDYSQDYYDFAAYSVGKGNTLVATDLDLTDASASNDKISGTAILYPSGYTLKGLKDELAKCYITDMTHVTTFGGEVNLNFRSFATKVRMAIYETVPGYSVKDVKFYTTDQGSTISSFATSEDATLIGSAFYTGGHYTITFPKTGSANASDPDFNKAHVSMTTAAGTDAYQTFGSINYTGGYLGTSAGAPSYTVR